MKLGLGAILSGLMALVVMGLWTALTLGQPDFRYAEALGNALYILSFPFGWLSKLFSGGHNGKPSDLVWYFLLMIPNTLLWGYVLATFVQAVRKLRQSASPIAAVEQNHQSPK